MNIKDNHYQIKEDYREELGYVIQTVLRDLLLDIIKAIQKKSCGKYDILAEFAADYYLSYAGMEAEYLITSCLPEESYCYDETSGKYIIEESRKLFSIVRFKYPEIYDMIARTIEDPNSSEEERAYVSYLLMEKHMDVSLCLKMIIFRWIRDFEHIEEAARILNMEKPTLRMVKEIMRRAIGMRNDYCGHRARESKCDYKKYCLYMNELKVIFTAFEKLSPKTNAEFESFYSKTVMGQKKFNLDDEVTRLAGELELSPKGRYTFKMKVIRAIYQATGNIQLEGGMVTEVEDTEQIRQIIYKIYAEFLAWKQNHQVKG